MADLGIAAGERKQEWCRRHDDNINRHNKNEEIRKNLLKPV